MEVNIIHSGSSGNCAVIDNEIVIDAGWPCDVEASILLLTHHHSDHVKYLDRFGGYPVYCTQETAEQIRKKSPYFTFKTLDCDKTVYHTGKNGFNYSITPIKVRHDVPCVSYFVVRDGHDACRTIFFGTDFNLIDKDREEWFIDMLENDFFSAVYIECNNTLDETDFVDIFFAEEGEPLPKDEYHRRKSYQNHCNADYLISLFRRAGYSEQNRYERPVTLLHKSSYYYNNNINKLTELASLARITNILYN